jgi:hypothetical protein
VAVTISTNASRFCPPKMKNNCLKFGGFKGRSFCFILVFFVCLKGDCLEVMVCALIVVTLFVKWSVGFQMVEITELNFTFSKYFVKIWEIWKTRRSHKAGTGGPPKLVYGPQFCFFV